jgi:predicted alpha/beta hydrolase
MEPPGRFNFPAMDGTPLTGSLCEPSYEPAAESDIDPKPAGRSAVLIAGALGVSQRHYAAFASWMAQRGDVVMSFDLRGMGASRLPQPGRSLRGLDADMLARARSGFPAAIAHLFAINGSRPITLIGHSLGLHHAGMTDALTQDRIAHAVGIASGAC